MTLPFFIIFELTREDIFSFRGVNGVECAAEEISEPAWGF